MPILSPHIQTLKALRDRLSDLSMRNRSLRMARLPRSRAFDLAWLDTAAKCDSLRVLEALLSGRKTSVRLVDIGSDDDDLAALHKGLTSLDREVRLVEQERGVYDLAVGVGFLCGNISEGRYLQGPLFLLPRRLVLERRARDGARWQLAQREGADPDAVDVNRTLLLALQRHLDISIDPDEIEEQARDSLFAGARERGWLSGFAETLASSLRTQGLSVAPALGAWGAAAVPDRVPALPLYKADELPATKVRLFEIRPHAVLSRYPLADTALLRDYDDLALHLQVNPAQPLGYAGALLQDPECLRRLEVAASKTPPPSSRWHIEPTDDSQEAVIAAVMDGQSLAVHGPPGTGKSQLIANLVATALAADKRVLVVSQKRPALDVVAQRLGPDLGRFVALVHDPARDRQLLCDQILRGARAARETVQPVDEARRRRLIDGIQADERWFEARHLALTDGAQGDSAFHAYVSRALRPGHPVVLRVRELPDLPLEDVQREFSNLDDYARDRKLAREPGTWLEQRPDWSERDKDDLEVLVDEHVPALGAALRATLTWSHDRPQGVPEIEVASAKHAAWARVGAWARHALDLSGDSWAWIGHLLPIEPNAHPEDILKRDVALLSEVLACRASAAGQIASAADADQTEQTCRSLEHTARRWYRFLLPSWYRLRREVLARLEIAPGGTHEGLFSAIAQWRAARRHGNAVAEAERGVRLLTRPGLEILSVTAEVLTRSATQAQEALSLLDAWRALADDVTELGLDGPPLSASAVSAMLSATEHATKAKETQTARDAAVGTIRAWVGPALDEWLKDVQACGDVAAVESRIIQVVSAQFSRMCALDRQCRAFENRAPALAELAWKAALGGAPKVSDEIALAYAERDVRRIEKGASVHLNAADTEVLRRRVQLTRSWSDLPATNRMALRAHLARSASETRMQDLDDLTRRAEQRRNRWTVRKLTEGFWNRGLSKLLPVWLCSPETVAAVFPLRPGLFDFVIFDEASQCTLAQGLTVAYRGATVVVAGDEQQLPPSNLFSTSLEDEDEISDDVIQEESLLSASRAAGSQHALSWHYRSRFPQLIQFSNQAYYKGALRVAPVPIPKLVPPALEWVSAGGTWTRRANEAEAALAVGLLRRALVDHPTLSIGVITLNRTQADFIEDEIERQAQASEEFRQAWEMANKREMDDRPFVRNLENVQGDERDIILLSVAYSADSTGRVPLRFGALSVSGGDRRLNVAVSRARRKMIVLCSFDPETQLQTDDSRSEGARRLREYLLYARAGGHTALAANALAATSAHRTLLEDVAHTLGTREWKADLEVGASAARVDLAVRSRLRPDRHLLAVLVDGPGARWAEGAIGREVGRAAYLERYQWHVYHLSARSWALDREAVLDGMLSRLEALESQPDALAQPPLLAMPERVQRTGTSSIQPRQGDISTRRSTSRLPTAPAANSAGGPQAATREVSPSASTSRPGSIIPGCTVRYRILDSGVEREVVLTGPTVPRGVSAISLDAPLAVALLDASKGDEVIMERGSESVELLVLEVRPPPR